MTIYKPIRPLAYGAVDAAIKLARKEAVETHDKINNGRKDGYHTRQEIYGSN